jgi:hypothetical protein
LGLGAWRYLKSETTRKRILALIVGITAAYWIVTIGKLILVPLQSWGAFHGNQYETYRWFAFWQTLAEANACGMSLCGDRFADPIPLRWKNESA